MLTSCGVNEANEFDGEEYFVTSTVGNMTNYEAFDIMIENSHAIFIVLDLVDETLLRGDFEIDHNSIEETWEELKEEIFDLDAWMSQNGFTSEEEVLRVFELGELREAALRDLVEITDEEVEAVIEMQLEAGAYDSEDMRDEIYNTLVAEAIREISAQELARLRYEADFIIFNETLAAAYENLLVMSGLEELSTYEEVSPDSADVIARINDVDITTGQVFAVLSVPLGLEVAFGQFDEIITADYSADPAEIDEMIEELRGDLGDDFYDALTAAGFESVEVLFENLERAQLEEALLIEYYMPSEERLRELYETMGVTLSGSHILVDDYSVAEDLIEQLQDAADFSETFAELAAEYSLCGSAAGGGDLGSWERGNMVEEFDDAIFELEIGEFTQTPVETQFGFHIIYKTGAADVPEFEDIRDDLVAHELAYLQQNPEILAGIWMDYRQKAELEFTNPVLQARFESITNTTEELDEDQDVE